MLIKMKIRSQLFFLLAVTFLGFCIALGVAILGMNKAENRFIAFLDGDLAQQLAFSDMYAQGLQMGQALRNIQLDPANPKAYDNFKKSASDFENALEDARLLTAGNPDRLEVVNKIAELRGKQKTIQDDILASVANNDIPAATAKTNKEETPVWRQIRQLLLNSQKAIGKNTTHSREDMLQSVKGDERLSAGLAVFAIILGLVLSGVIATNISRQLAQLSVSMNSLADGHGDLTQRIRVEGKTEIAEIASAFNRFMEGLQQIIATVKTGADDLTAATVLLSNSSQQIATSSQKQSESVSSTAAAVEQMTVSIAHVSDNAGTAKSIAEHAADLASEGKKLLSDATAEIQRIADTVQVSSQSIRSLQQRSEQISGIANVIKEIADQTNLLALNAAIEAARAGEQGRGFAVVADEVRKLAERTGSATSEIKSMIETIQDETQAAVSGMDSGTQQVGNSIGMFQRLIDPLQQLQDGAATTRDNLIRLADATREQSMASNEIASHVEEIAQMAEENSAAISETSNAARRMESLAASLRESVGQFRV